MKKRVIFIAVACAAFTVLQLPAQQTEKEKKAAQKQQKAQLELGAKLYEKYSCMSCHGAEGIAQGDLRQAYKKYTDEQLKSYIKNPNKFNNLKMPIFSDIIPDADYKPLIAYVKWLGEKAEKKKK